MFTSGPDVGGQVLGAGRPAVAAASSQQAPAPTQLMPYDALGNLAASGRKVKSVKSVK